MVVTKEGGKGQRRGRERRVGHERGKEGFESKQHYFFSFTQFRICKYRCLIYKL